jgi:hypothetical protein
MSCSLPATCCSSKSAGINRRCLPPPRFDCLRSHGLLNHPLNGRKSSSPIRHPFGTHTLARRQRISYGGRRTDPRRNRPAFARRKWRSPARGAGSRVGFPSRIVGSSSSNLARSLCQRRRTGCHARKRHELRLAPVAPEAWERRPARDPAALARFAVSVGESVHLIGVSYAEPDVAQKVYSGRSRNAVTEIASVTVSLLTWTSAASAALRSWTMRAWSWES